MHLLLSGRYWLWLLPAIVPPILFLVVPVLLLALTPLARPAWRPIAAMTVAALLLGVPLTGFNVKGLGGGRALGPGSVHVFSWNTEYWDQDNAPARFYDFLKRQRADVYLLQEYINFDEHTNQVTRINDLARLHHEFPSYHIVTRGELVTISRYPVVAHPLVTPDRYTADEGTQAGWLPYFERAKVLRTDLRIGSRVMSFYNVHIPVQFDMSKKPYGGTFYTAMHQKAGSRRQQFAALTREIRTGDRHLLVAGDFNTSPAMGELRRVKKLGQDVTEAGGPLYPVSWPADGAVTTWRLDWAFVRGGPQPLRYRLLDPVGLSDHRAQDMWVNVGGHQ
ncbi:endonuclease/exonuclease/phosphatase family protein [Streptomyces sp. ADMS]|uniref:endonuclease/exonuclease/phosphatase family protein n=1 Tax=Streptomyces sp. ADMS TaxID=3071415 RepID=UPI00296E91F9|nr:endonuclease/exonuclease/phosphatase family protein [Streptomyces sp. ADMS]MDW4910798.1 endonuclease/exonuclease/phosphatase family protein [Streptomyces sp. ADMS]